MAAGWREGSWNRAGRHSPVHAQHRGARVSTPLVADAVPLPLPVAFIHTRPHLPLAADCYCCCRYQRLRWTGGSGAGSRRRARDCNAAAAAPAVARAGEATLQRCCGTDQGPLRLLHGFLAGATSRQRGWPRHCARHTALLKQMGQRLPSLTGAKCSRHTGRIVGVQQPPTTTKRLQSGSDAARLLPQCIDRGPGGPMSTNH